MYSKSYGYSSYSASPVLPEWFGGVLLVVVIIAIIVLLAWLASISLFVKSAREKGYYIEGAGMLWFIGIFASPIVLGIYVASLPDKRASEAPVALTPAAPDGDLPSV